MSDFEFLLSLFGVLLGFSLAEVLSGLIRTTRSSAHVRVGFLTPMLGLFVLLDILSFWIFSWGIRDTLSVRYGVLVFGLAVSGAYYWASSMIFPAAPEKWLDLDAYYLETRRKVLASVLLCNLVANGVGLWHAGRLPGPISLMLMALYSAFVLVAIATKHKVANGVCLAGLIGTYLVLAAI